jgi:hypothetical protein
MRNQLVKIVLIDVAKTCGLVSHYGVFEGFKLIAKKLFVNNVQDPKRSILVLLISFESSWQ